jgi:hypothetical protein
LSTHVLKYQSRSGHTTIEYDTDDAKQVEETREKFNELIRTNYLAYGRTAGSTEATQLRDFDPTVEETVMTLPIAGG